MRRLGLIFMLLAVGLLPMGSAYASDGGKTDAAAELHKQLIYYASDALIGAGDREWTTVTEAVAGLNKVWGAADRGGAAEAAALTAAIAKAESALAQAADDPDAAYKAVSALAKSADAFVSADDEAGGQGDVRQQVRAMLPNLEKSLAAAKESDFAAAKQAYAGFVSDWGQAESAIRKRDTALYGQIEVKISGARIAINTEPPSAERTAAKLQELIQTLDDYASGRANAGAEAKPESGIASIADLMALLGKAEDDIKASRAADAAAKMDLFVSAWPNVEGEVSTRSSQAYTAIETAMISLSSALLSNPPDYAKAGGLADQLMRQLEPYANASGYSAWDAAVILFREGLEAILIIAALLAMLSRAGHADKRKWIWSGAGAGFVASAAFAFVLTVLLSNLSTGSSREMLEGITGLIAVVFMITVGAWLHGKSNLANWNRFVERAIGASLAKGAVWSLALTAFLSVLREGAETIIFYVGMAPTIRIQDLLLGIGGSVVVLAAIAFAILKLSARIPVRPFFLLAGLLLYYMAFKFVGKSIHALQVAGKLPAHVPGYLPEVPSLGIFNCWEVIIPQAAVLVLILGNFARVEWRKRAGAVRAAPRA
ncbi:FTR1 family iron permease [Cohnella nanjingensis]|uniref:FTR1 family protein n=1 Tax=Cohnella nanjingensis TaxID=1387779 RepID=A0A7X0VHI7_9BACL|nr:FTR1 family protein [Cohnella nanjingensis]MBB6672684.1 FTR1 family protein [Cohnella nanjingensis]